MSTEIYEPPYIAYEQLEKTSPYDLATGLIADFLDSKPDTENWNKMRRMFLSGKVSHVNNRIHTALGILHPAANKYCTMPEDRERKYYANLEAQIEHLKSYLEEIRKNEIKNA